MPDRPGHFHRHRFPAEVISYAVWLYYRFPLSHRDVEELLSERGIQVSYEAVRRWANKFGPIFAEDLRRRRVRPGRTWHLDEVFLRMNGRRVYLWRAVDEHDAPTTRAHATWNNVGTRMTFTYGGASTVTPDGVVQPVMVIDYWEQWDNNQADWLMRASKRSDAQGCHYMNYILVNDEPLFELDMFSYSATVDPNKWDFESAMLHEMGHLLTLGHVTGSAYYHVVMHEFLTRGQNRRSLSSADREGIMKIYGPR
jgi:hypothetical protein